ncbi:hypothetical protein LX32DRAFT_247377 [Colletotrichum zoysiae]|uniref:Uncharacterized protein n=1 Tax=Colletotrichum zoysiae TaxID=1216348 RepID=A0AAD9HMT9_9PEZI|nr:hypothetical protein LX32DRAFT_247377 [Colletotrichum zoysiae]
MSSAAISLRTERGAGLASLDPGLATMAQLLDVAAYRVGNLQTVERAAPLAICKKLANDLGTRSIMTLRRRATSRSNTHSSIRKCLPNRSPLRWTCPPNWAHYLKPSKSSRASRAQSIAADQEKKPIVALFRGNKSLTARTRVVDLCTARPGRRSLDFSLDKTYPSPRRQHVDT